LTQVISLSELKHQQTFFYGYPKWNFLFPAVIGILSLQSFSHLTDVDVAPVAIDLQVSLDTGHEIPVDEATPFFTRHFLKSRIGHSAGTTRQRNERGS